MTNHYYVSIMNSLTINKKTQIAKKFGIYFYEENNTWYFYNKKTYDDTKKQYHELSLYCIEEISIDKKQLGNRCSYLNFDSCFQAAFIFYKQHEAFIHFVKIQNNKKLFNKLQDLIPISYYLEKKLKI